jgi:hypothetical protein
MSLPHHKARLNPAEEAQLEKALVRLIGSTGRSHRAKNLLEVAKEIAVAKKLLGSRKAVAKRIGLSDEMLREFASVKDLHKSVKMMLKNGHLTSVDVAYRVSMLPKADQPRVAKAYIEGHLSGKDIRDIVTLWRKNPRSDVQDIIDRVKGSRDIVRYVVRFRLHKKTKMSDLHQRFADMLGEHNIVSLENNGRIVTLIISEEGRKMLEREAKKHRVTKRKLIQLISDAR